MERMCELPRARLPGIPDCLAGESGHVAREQLGISHSSLSFEVEVVLIDDETSHFFPVVQRLEDRRHVASLANVGHSF
jgi:hypothetical protein